MDKREVTIKFKSTMYDTGEGIEVSAKGIYFYKDEKHQVMYTEVNESGPDTKNILKFDEESLEVTKLGATKTSMLYKAGNTYNDIYHTPLGEFDMCIKTEEYAMFSGVNGYDLVTLYNLELGGAHVSKCKVEISIK